MFVLSTNRVKIVKEGEPINPTPLAPPPPFPTQSSPTVPSPTLHTPTPPAPAPTNGCCSQNYKTVTSRGVAIPSLNVYHADRLTIRLGFQTVFDRIVLSGLENVLTVSTHVVTQLHVYR